MPRNIIKHEGKQNLKIADGKMEALTNYLTVEIEDAFSARSFLEADWREDLVRYEGVPKLSARNIPIENAPNIEITLGAIAADSIYAQAIDLIFGTTPLVTCQPMVKGTNDKVSIDTAKAIQRYINWLARNEVGIRVASEDTVLDDVQLGTGVFYIPWTEQRKKTRTSKIIRRRPIVYSIPPEDCITPIGTPYGIQDTPWIAIRFWKTIEELFDSAQYDGWNITDAQPAGAKDWVRNRREMLGKQVEGVTRKGNIYDTFDVYAYYDIDGDGLDEDLCVVWNHTGRSILKISYNPCDRRPIEKMVYQRRAHLFYGLGVLKMMRPFQEEMTEVHNHQVLNAMLANARIWKGKEGEIPNTMKIWGGKVITMRDPATDLIPEVMADTYPSMIQIQSLIMQLADNRVGTNAMSQPRPSQIMGSRTPGITALSLLQQVNRRFTPAFDDMRHAIVRALRQCLYRTQERVLAGDAGVMVDIIELLGPEDGQLVINLLRDEDFDKHVSMELTASSASVNREADRQNAIMLVNILAQYYQRTLELVMLASNPQTPEPVREVARKIASSAGEIIDRTIRTFDQVRDPATFIVSIDEELDNIPGIAQEGLTQLLGMFGGMGGAGGGQPLELPFGTEGRMMQ